MNDVCCFQFAISAAFKINFRPDMQHTHRFLMNNVFIQPNSKIKLDKVFRRKAILSRTCLNPAQTVTQPPPRHASGWTISLS